MKRGAIMEQLRVGYGKQEITPAFGAHLQGNPKVRIAEETADPLHVRCVVFEHTDIAVMLYFDLVGIKQDLIEECVAEWEPCWVDYAEEGYDSEEDWQDAYYSDCGAIAEEISEAEYKEETKPVWPFELVRKEEI
jgi:hypothetical protein